MTHVGYFDADKMFTYLKGYAVGKNMQQTLIAMNFARKLHSGQFRKGGSPYIIHPLTMACQVISLGIDDDELIATILLHDVVEDCGVELMELPTNDTVKEAVGLLTYKKPKKYLERDGIGISITEVKKAYYEKLSKNRYSILGKLVDRCHNVSSMAGTFTPEKVQEYIVETEEYVLPLYRIAKDLYPEYQNALFLIKYHICSVLEAIKGMHSYDEKAEKQVVSTKGIALNLIRETGKVRFTCEELFSVIKSMHDKFVEDKVIDNYKTVFRTDKEDVIKDLEVNSGYFEVDRKSDIFYFMSKDSIFDIIKNNEFDKYSLNILLECYKKIR